MELRHLEAFVAVADTRTFTAAAARLHLAQQSLSRLVAQLERELGVRLFDRTTRTVRLTPPGEAMLAPARRALAGVAEAAAAARAPAGAVTEIRVDVSSTGLETGSLIVEALRRAHPDVLVHEVEVGVEAGVRELREGRLDLVFGLVTGDVHDLEEEVLRHEAVVLGMAVGHRLAARDEVPVADLDGEALLLPSEEAAGEWLRFVATFCRQAGATPRRWHGITHGSSAAAEVVASGDCVVPTCAWRRTPEDVVFRPLVPAPVYVWSMLSRPDTVGLEPLRATVRTLAATEGWITPIGKVP